MDRKELEKLSEVFLTQFFSLIESEYGIETDGLFLDHICWRCDSLSAFEQMEAELLKMGSMFHKSIHNGRLISLIELNEAISYRGREVSLIELPSPKEGKHYPNGFEHAELVYNDLNQLVSKYPDLAWNTKNIGKEINPDVKLTQEGITVKFHPYSLAHVVKVLEKDNS